MTGVQVPEPHGARFFAQWDNNSIPAGILVGTGGDSFCKTLSMAIVPGRAAGSRGAYFSLTETQPHERARPLQLRAYLSGPCLLGARRGLLGQSQSRGQVPRERQEVGHPAGRDEGGKS